MKRLLSVLVCVGVMAIGFSPLAHADGFWWETGDGSALLNRMGLNQYAEYITGINEYDVMGNMIMQLSVSGTSQIVVYNDGRVVTGHTFIPDDGWQIGALEYRYEGVNLYAIEQKMDDGVYVTIIADPFNLTDGLTPTLTFKVENNGGAFIGRDGIASIVSDYTVYGQEGQASHHIGGVGDVALVGIQFSAAWVAHHGGSATQLEDALRAELSVFGSPEFGTMGGNNIFQAMLDGINAGESSLMLNSASLTLNLYHGYVTSFQTATVSMDLEIPEDVQASNFSEDIASNMETNYPEAFQVLADLDGDGVVSQRERSSFTEGVLQRVYRDIIDAGGPATAIEESAVITFTHVYEPEHANDAQPIEIEYQFTLQATDDGGAYLVGSVVGGDGPQAVADQNLAYFNSNTLENWENIVEAGEMHWGGDTPPDTGNIGAQTPDTGNIGEQSSYVGTVPDNGAWQDQI
ncbi:MAG: hypothetical protein JXD21_00175 [Candidatus Omnitrophica bacterium]|nr:hypothetical protein [Candidatus Omnitrophota bacterium]